MRRSLRFHLTGGGAGGPPEVSESCCGSLMDDANDSSAYFFAVEPTAFGGTFATGETFVRASAAGLAAAFADCEASAE
jgi:hypothetical protein